MCQRGAIAPGQDIADVQHAGFNWAQVTGVKPKGCGRGQQAVREDELRVGHAWLSVWLRGGSACRHRAPRFCVAHPPNPQETRPNCKHLFRGLRLRPAGEVRMALRDAAQALRNEARVATWRDLAQRAQVGFAVAQATVENMARCGELRRVGPVRVAHSRRPMVGYVLAAQVGITAPAANDAAPIEMVMRNWMAQR